LISEYVYEDVRYLIFEDIGCLNSTYQTWVEVIINPFPCLVLAIIAVVYAILSFCAFRRIRDQSKVLLSIHSGLTNGRYIRLMFLAAMVAICSLGAQSYALTVSMSDGIAPWTSFKELHANISVVPKQSAQHWRSGSDSADLEFDRWLWVICALLFFAFFGFSDEAMKHYRYAMSLAGSYVGVSSKSFGSHSSSSRYVI